MLADKLDQGFGGHLFGNPFLAMFTGTVPTTMMTMGRAAGWHTIKVFTGKMLLKHSELPLQSGNGYKSASPVDCCLTEAQTPISPCQEQDEEDARSPSVQ